jgi:EAL domain-containing protein (putative c-di-GMP-specific phosphodiesterase class I)
VIAEGIQTAAELTVLIDLGIGYGQGFHLAQPGSLGPEYPSSSRRLAPVRGHLTKFSWICGCAPGPAT